MWNLISLDGFFDGAKPWQLDWHHGVVDAEFEEFSLRQLCSAEGLLFGRRTYEGMAAYWTKAEGEVAGWMNRLPKFVFSNTLEKADWTNTTLLSGDAARTARGLKQRSTGDLYV